MASFVVCTGQILLRDEIKEDKRGGVCGTHGREEKCVQDVGGET
jgi:hypothetical protein